MSTKNPARARVTTQTYEARIFSTLIYGHSETNERTSKRKLELRVDVPGYPIIGDGKSDRQNHSTSAAHRRRRCPLILALRPPLEVPDVYAAAPTPFYRFVNCPIPAAPTDDAPRDKRALGKHLTFYATYVIYLYFIPAVRLLPARIAVLLEGGARVAARPCILTACGELNTRRRGAKRSRAHRAHSFRRARGPRSAIRTQFASLDMQGTEAALTQRSKRGRRYQACTSEFISPCKTVSDK